MSEVDPKVIKAMETKLMNLVRSVVDHAATDLDFARKLEEVLLSDSLSKMVREKKVESKRPSFAPVPFLHEHGEERLRSELNGMTDHDLRIIVRSERIRRGKEVNSLDRATLISEIISHSQRRLDQGATFLK